MSTFLLKQNPVFMKTRKFSKCIRKLLLDNNKNHPVEFRWPKPKSVKCHHAPMHNIFTNIIHTYQDKHDKHVRHAFGEYPMIAADFTTHQYLHGTTSALA